jgi:hypothetical protein
MQQRSCTHTERFPKLPMSGSPTQTQLLNQWIKDCNKHHKCYRRADNVRPPTRLIDVGNSQSRTLKLDRCSDKRASHKYVALSHPWGDTDLHPPFCTTSNNINKFEISINFDDLPQNFKDAVEVTRNLEIQYLWIDSICIIQGKGGDFDTECKLMEDYYSGAYCTIAASCSSGSSDGFLKPRRPESGPKARLCYPLNNGVDLSPESRFYVCSAIDDFARDVEKGFLSTRGWIY